MKYVSQTRKGGGVMNKDMMETALQTIKNDLVQVTTPDVSEVAELVLKAKGDNRSLREFAELTGISAPSLSRIINGKITRPLSLETIVSIVGNSDSFTLQTLYGLARANGYMSKAEQSTLRARQQLRVTRNSAYVTIKSLMHTIVIAELFQRSADMDKRILETNPGTLCTAIKQDVKYDFSIQVNIDEEQYDWAFITFPLMAEDFVSSGIALDKLVRNIVREVSPIFLTDAWMPDQYKDMKISFCFVDSEIYNEFVRITEHGTLHNSFSAVLLNEREGKLEEEYVYETKQKHSSVFDFPIEVSVSFSDDDIADEIGECNYVFVEDGKEEF